MNCGPRAKNCLDGRAAPKEREQENGKEILGFGWMEARERICGGLRPIRIRPRFRILFEQEPRGSPPMEERLQKIIARAGIASRRRAEEMIASGLVTVNGQVVTQLGTKADPERDHIKVSGKLVHLDAHPLYLLLNKPPEIVSTMSDPEGRRSLHDLLHGVTERVYPVGRLEYHAAGAIFLTNDGDLANKMLQSHSLVQTWNFKLQSLLTFDEIAQLSRATSSRISRMKGPEAAWYEVTLVESRRDVLRNRLFQTGHPVEKMKRVAIAGIELGRLAPGQFRELSAGEVASLRRAASGERIGEPSGPHMTVEPPVEEAAELVTTEARPAFVARPAAPGRENRFSRPRDNRGARPPRRDGKPEWKRRGPARAGSERGEFRGPRREGSDGGKFRGPRREGPPAGEFPGKRREGSERGEFRGPRREGAGDRKSRGPRRDVKPEWKPRNARPGGRPPGKPDSRGENRGADRGPHRGPGRGPSKGPGGGPNRGRNGGKFRPRPKK